MKILTVDDDESVRQALTVSLRLLLKDVEVLQAPDGETGLEMFFETNPDLVLLDVNMPRMSGFEVLREIRRVSDLPVIMLTARDEDMDQVRGFELGADEYLHKPIRHATLVARIKSALRRAARAPVDELPDFVAGDLAIHFQNQQVTVAGEEVKLTPIEYRLLYHLVRNAGHVLPHQTLLDRVWGTDHEVGPEYLKVFISRVRAKLRRPGGQDHIQTERGVGYRFLKGEGPSTPRSRIDAAASVGDETPPSTWLSIDRVDPSPRTRNARQIYSRARLAELADSIRQYGVLEPILVIAVGNRYEVVAGNRRLQAARLAGLDRIPAIIRTEVDERSRLLVNVVENAQRAELRATERIGVVRQLASSGLGVREIARGTGLSPATISRWIRIAHNKQVMDALEEGRIDLFRAMHLAGVSDPGLLKELIDIARRYTPEDFFALVQQRTVTTGDGTGRGVGGTGRRLVRIAEQLAAVDHVTPEAEQPLECIVHTANALLRQIRSVAGPRHNEKEPTPRAPRGRPLSPSTLVQ